MQTLAGEIQAAGGIVTAQDLLSAQPIVKQPISAQVQNAKLSSTGASSAYTSISTPTRMPSCLARSCLQMLKWDYVIRCDFLAECVWVAQVWGYELAVPPPPSSGATVILALHILSGKVHTPHPPYPHLTLSTCLQLS